MPLENNPQSIADLDASWPLGGDNTLDGDNHIRNIKRILQVMFPDGPTGIGFDSPVLATVNEINYLQGVTSNVQAQINALNGGASAGKLFLAAPDGAQLLWGLPTAPAGWEFTENYANLSVVVSPASLAGTTQGVDSPLEWSHSHAVQPFALQADQIPPHIHNLTITTEGPSRFVSYDSGIGVQQRFVDNFAGPSYPPGTADAGTTSGNILINRAVDQAITAPTTWRPLVYHMASITRNSDLDT